MLASSLTPPKPTSTMNPSLTRTGLSSMGMWKKQSLPMRLTLWANLSKSGVMWTQIVQVTSSYVTLRLASSFTSTMPPLFGMQRNKTLSRQAPLEENLWPSRSQLRCSGDYTTNSEWWASQSRDRLMFTATITMSSSIGLTQPPHSRRSQTTSRSTVSVNQLHLMNNALLTSQPIPILLTFSQSHFQVACTVITLSVKYYKISLLPLQFPSNEGFPCGALSHKIPHLHILKLF